MLLLALAVTIKKLPKRLLRLVSAARNAIHALAARNVTALAQIAARTARIARKLSNQAFVQQK